MRIIRPKRLRQGDVIGICAPASPPQSRDALEKGIRYLEGLGYHVHLSKNLFRKRGYLAGTDAQRTADLHELFSNRHVKAIFAARGGFGTQRLLPMIDYNLIRRNPKILVGYSDITALQLALFTKAGLVSLSGPLVVEMPLGGTSEEVFWRFLTSTKPIATFTATERILFRHPGKHSSSRGRLIGGNLSLISAMVGSPYFPKVNNAILFLEEIDERPYRIDRTLQHLKLNGVLDKIRGVILGSFVDCLPAKGKPSLTLQQVLKDLFSTTPYPVISGIRHGHIPNSYPLPFGTRVDLETSRNEIGIVDPLVS